MSPNSSFNSLGWQRNIGGELRLERQVWRRRARPARIVKNAAGDGDQVGPTLGDDGFGRLRFGNQSHCNRRQSAAGANRCRQRHLVVGAQRNFLLR